jgi:hypothetical protein
MQEGSMPRSSLRKVKMDVLPIELATGFQGNAIMFFLISLIVPCFLQMVARDTLSVRIGLGLAWTAPTLGLWGIASVRAEKARIRRFGVSLILLSGVFVFVRYVLTSVALGSFWPTAGDEINDPDTSSTPWPPAEAQEEAAAANDQALSPFASSLSLIGSLLDAVLLLFSIFFYCAYMPTLCRALADGETREKAAKKFTPADDAEAGKTSRSSSQSYSSGAAFPDGNGGVASPKREDVGYAGPGVPENANRWALAEIERVKVELLGLDLPSRRKRLRELRRHYHPDKNAGGEHSVTPVFIWIQSWWEEEGA